MCNFVWIRCYIKKQCTMLKRCCCFDLRTGSVLIGAVRLMSWLIILTGISYVVWELFILRNSGMIHFKTMENLEQNGKFLSEEYIALWYRISTTLNCNWWQYFFIISVYVLVLVMVLSLIGVILESLMIVAVLQPKRGGGYIRAWFWLSGFAIFASVSLAIFFLLHNIGTIRPRGNILENALCSLADVVFFFIPEFLLGPRLEPVLRAMLIIAHFSLPILHALSFYVVYSFYKCRHRFLYNQHSENTGGGLGYAPPSAPDSNGRRSVTPMIQDQVIPYKPKLCHKCQCHQQNNGVNGAVYTSHQPLLEEAPIETTC